MKGKEMKRWLLIQLAIVSVCISAGTNANGKIPYPQALESATIIQNSLDDVHRKAFAIGNGDLNLSNNLNSSL